MSADSSQPVFESTFLIFAGWLLATLNPGVVEAIKRPKRRRELLHAFAIELRELRYKAVLVFWHQRSGTGSLDQHSLDIVKTLVFDHPVADGAPSIAENLKQALNVGEEKYIAIMNAKGAAENLGAWPALYYLPFLSSHAADFVLFTPQSQAHLMRVLEELDLFNNQVEFVRELNNKTFTLTGQNHGINSGNLAKAQRRLADRAEALVRAISRIVDPRGNTLTGFK